MLLAPYKSNQWVITFTLLLIPFFSLGQKIKGSKLLKKSIAFHDPNGEWETFEGAFNIKESRPNGKEAMTKLTLSNALSKYSFAQEKEKYTFIRHINNGRCSSQIIIPGGAYTLSKEEKEKLDVTCESTKRMRDYHTYLYGLPMKLKDPGTLIDEKVRSVEFQGKTYYALKVSYDPEVGKDTWYFYMDPDTYALEGYRFYHDESQNDGEYITLEGLAKVSSMQLPKIRKWYMNADDKYLGTDEVMDP